MDGPRWTVPEDIVRLCEPQPGQLHLGQAGPEDQVISEWLKTTPSRDDQTSRAANPGPLAPESPFQRHKTRHP